MGQSEAIVRKIYGNFEKNLSELRNNVILKNFYEILRIKDRFNGKDKFSMPKKEVGLTTNI